MNTYHIQKLDIKTKHYKNKKLEFDYIQSNDFEKIDSPSVIGEIKLSTISENEDLDRVIIESNDKTFTFELMNKKSNENNILGYIKVEENTYVAILKQSIIVPIILIVIFLGIIIGLLYNVFKPTSTTEDTPNLEFEQGDDWDGNMPSNGEQSEVNTESIEIPGYAELYISSENPEIQLINPEGNTVYFIYTIKENDVVIYETKAIEPNKMISLNLQELLEVGEHNLSFVISTYDVETQAACNGATQDVKVTVRE